MKAPLRSLAALVAVLCPLLVAQTAVGAPTVDFTISDPAPEPGDEVTFRATLSEPVMGHTFSWRFGDRTTGSGETAAHTYDRPALRTVTLLVRDALGVLVAGAQHDVRVNAPPVARFTWTPGTPLVGQTVTFNPSRSSDDSRIVRYDWDLDGNSRSGSQGFEVSRTSPTTLTASYPTPGVRRIRLRVTDEDGKQDIRAWNVTTNVAPRASFIVSPTKPVSGDEITFSSTSADPDGPLASQRWDLDGDGQYGDAAGAVVRKKLPKGLHVVRLRVTDTLGATATAERTIKVRSRPLRLLEGVKVTLFGDLTLTGARLRRLVVRTPGHATVTIRCEGRSCPKKTTKRRTSKTKRLRFKKYERSFIAGTVITVKVTRDGYIGSHTTIKIRSRLRRYIRRDRCVRSATSRPVACPDS